MNPPELSPPAVDAGLVAGWVRVLAGAGAGLDDAGRVELLTALEDLKAAACAAQARVAVDFAVSQEHRQAEAGVPPVRRGAGIAAQVALARHESPHRGGRLLGLARALVTEMPQTLAALEVGDLNEWRATLIARETGCLSAADRTQVDAELWADPDTTIGLGDQALAAKTRALAYRTDPHSVVARAARAETDRHVTLRPAPDTMAYLTALLPVAQGVAAYAALGAAADTARAAGDPRSRGQVLADTLVQRLTGQQEAAAVPVTVTLVMSEATLLSADPEPGLLSGYGPVPASVARRLAVHADRAGLARIRRLYARPADGALVALESRARCFPKGLADFIELRDQTCRTPWCDAPIRHHDHILDHTAGGPTSHTNGQGLCQACNHTKQAPGWHARPGPDGTVHTTTPTGHTYPSPVPHPPGRPPPQPNAPPRLVLDIRWDRPIDYTHAA